MRRTASFLIALALFVALSIGGGWAAERSALSVPGPVLGLLAYAALLSLGWLDWTVAAARWLSGLLGAMIVPALVGVALFSAELARGGWRLAAALVVGALATGLVAALTFRLAGGRG